MTELIVSWCVGVLVGIGISAASPLFESLVAEAIWLSEQLKPPRPHRGLPASWPRRTRLGVSALMAAGSKGLTAAQLAEAIGAKNAQGASATIKSIGRAVIGTCKREDSMTVFTKTSDGRWVLNREAAEEMWLGRTQKVGLIAAATMAAHDRDSDPELT